MKKVKSIMAAIIALAFAASAGCSGASNTSNTEAAANTNKPATLKIVNYLCGFYKEEVKEGEVSNKDNWEQTMSDKYGVDISLNAKIQDDSIIYLQYNDPNAQGQPYEGVWCYSAELIQIPAKQGNILPLEDYLKDNKTWNALPKEMRDCFTIDGHSWAIPTGYSPEPSARIIRKDWLAKLGLQAPTSIYELKEVLKAFKNSGEINQGGKVTPLVADNFLTEIEDIWNAFGLSARNGCINWDAQEGCFVDQMLKPAAKDALTFLRSLYNEELMSQLYQKSEEVSLGTVYNNNDIKTQGLAGSYLGPLGSGYSIDLAKSVIQQTENRELDYSKAEDIKRISSFYTMLKPLTGSTDSPVQVNTASYIGYVLAKDTQDPKATINFMVDMLFSSKQNFLECYLGVNDLWSIDKQSRVTFHYKDEETMQSYTMAGLNNYVMGLYDETTLGFAMTGDSQSEAQMKLANEITGKKITAAKKMIQTGQVVIMTAEQYYPFYLMKTNTNGSALQNLLYQAIADPETTVEQALDIYRQICKSRGVQDYLDGINKNVGKNSNQKY